MYEFYHHYFMDFVNVTVEPTLADQLFVNVTGPEDKIVKDPNEMKQVTIMKGYKHIPYINPKFINYKEVLKYTDINTHLSYKSIYDYVELSIAYNLRQFKFGVVVYDEIEHFP